MRLLSPLAAKSILLLALLTLPLAAQSQRYHITYAPNTQEALLLQLIEQLDGAAKVQQMEDFLTRYPTHPSVMWVLSYLQVYYGKGENLDKAIAAGEKLFALQPDDLEAAVNNQKLAEKKNDPALITKWTDLATLAAQKLLGAPKPFYVPQEEWNKRLEYAGGLISQADYAIFKKAIAEEKPAERVKIFDELLIKAPNSIYAIQAYPHMMRAYRSMGNNDKALFMAEKILAKDINHEEALLLVAQIWLDRRQNYPRVLTIANRLLALGQGSKKPDGISEDDWSKRRGFYVGAAYQMIGSAQVFQNNFEQADRAFRSAIPYIKGNAQAEASAYFYIGWSNYYMEKYKEAANYFKMCIGIPSPFQSQAVRQIEGMKRERRIIED